MNAFAHNMRTLFRCGRIAPLACGFLLFVQFTALGSEPTAVKVMSFNIRYGSARDGENRWELRKDLVVQTIREYDPDLLGTQETLQFQADYLSKHLPDYAYVGWSRVPGEKNEHCGIFYRRSRFTQRVAGQFWLSETPAVAGSKSWDSSLPRVVTWVDFTDRTTGRAFRFLNTHFDHRGRTARVKSAELIRNHVSALDTPVIVTGDFNCGAGSDPWKAFFSGTQTPLLIDSYRRFKPEKTADEGTFGGFRGTTAGARIDWILHSRHYKTQNATILRTNANGRYPSDHYPVTATLLLP